MTPMEEFVARLDDADPVVASEARQLLWTAAYVSSVAMSLPARERIADELTRELAATVEPTGPVATNVPDSVTLVPVPKYSAAARRFLCQVLARIAGDRQIPTLIGLF